ncbi:predicted protein [Histoplasma capsulatum G186AR]|uniref:Uncharacterized protein n=1 Tax=Ajellomyces capsulatus (strain G186AR / H82 / ATCC MYA-2454 / RMSCC 2432) TaxID=447093 RepID=C0NWF1_AJECG|nr:uncharacterized protein HCBG_07481 [Histoplasma capsulatum G186AR]EEH04256.1 predicted protein [Histoplasma capsulatum G186AR]
MNNQSFKPKNASKGRNRLSKQKPLGKRPSIFHNMCRVLQIGHEMALQRLGVVQDADTDDIRKSPFRSLRRKASLLPNLQSQIPPAQNCTPSPLPELPGRTVLTHSSLAGPDRLRAAITTPPQSKSPEPSIQHWEAGAAGVRLLGKVLAEGAKTYLENGELFLTTNGCSNEEVATTNMSPFNGIFAVTPDNLPLAVKVGKSIEMMRLLSRRLFRIGFWV